MSISLFPLQRGERASVPLIPHCRKKSACPTLFSPEICIQSDTHNVYSMEPLQIAYITARIVIAQLVHYESFSD